MDATTPDRIAARIIEVYDLAPTMLGDTQEKKRAWVRNAIATEKDLPCDEVIIQATRDGVIYDLACRGKDLKKDPEVMKAKTAEERDQTLARMMAARVAYNMATTNLARELDRKNQKQMLLKYKKLQLYPGYATRAAWSEIQKSRA